MCSFLCGSAKQRSFSGCTHFQGLAHSLSDRGTNSLSEISWVCSMNAWLVWVPAEYQCCCTLLVKLLNAFSFLSLHNCEFILSILPITQMIWRCSTQNKVTTKRYHKLHNKLGRTFTWTLSHGGLALILVMAEEVVFKTLHLQCYQLDEKEHCFRQDHYPFPDTQIWRYESYLRW